MIDKVLKGLKCCVAKEKGLTVKDCDVDCTYFHEGVFCKNALHGDTIRIIHQLESRLTQAERERDAAVNDIVKIVHELDGIACEWCKNAYFNEAKCKECRFHNESFEWQGVCPTNTKEDA